MIYTDNYYRWKRVEDVNQTPTGILAELHGERLSIDVVRADLLRIKISRGGVFDESPTFAVCVSIRWQHRRTFGSNKTANACS